MSNPERHNTVTMTVPGCSHTAISSGKPSRIIRILGTLLGPINGYTILIWIMIYRKLSWKQGNPFFIQYMHQLTL
jgi:hypothetical protein